MIMQINSCLLIIYSFALVFTRRMRTRLIMQSNQISAFDQKHLHTWIFVRSRATVQVNYSKAWFSFIVNIADAHCRWSLMQKMICAFSSSLLPDNGT
jgi:hypothetical protein